MRMASDTVAGRGCSSQVAQRGVPDILMRLLCGVGAARAPRPIPPQPPCQKFVVIILVILFVAVVIKPPVAQTWKPAG